VRTSLLISTPLFTFASDYSFMRDDVMVFRGKIEDAESKLLEISKVYHTNLSAFHKVQGDLQEAEELRQAQENKLLALLSASLLQRSREHIHSSVDSSKSLKSTDGLFF
jgi:hypothetical protein